MRFLSERPEYGKLFFRFGLGKMYGQIRDISCVNLAITTRCNLTCPECCCNIPGRKSHWDADVDYLTRAAASFRSLDRIQLTGGEPSLHPQFKELVPQVKNLFKGQRLTIESNGVRFKEFPHIFEHFDEIHATHYTEPEFENDNTDAIEFLKDYLKGKHTQLHVHPIKHVPRNHRGTLPCSRGLLGTISCFQGLVYPCCMGWGIEGAKGVTMDTNWRKNLQSTPLPCSTCFFAE